MPPAASSRARAAVPVAESGRRENDVKSLVQHRLVPSVARFDTRAGNAGPPCRTCHAPPPAVAYTISSRAGIAITPITPRPAWRQPTSVAHKGTPRINDFVPSIGSTIHS